MMVWQNAWMVVAVSSSSLSAAADRARSLRVGQAVRAEPARSGFGTRPGKEIVDIAMDPRAERARRKLGEGDGGDRARFGAACQQHRQAAGHERRLAGARRRLHQQRQIAAPSALSTRAAFVGELRHRELQTRAKSPKARPNAACLIWK